MTNNTYNTKMNKNLFLGTVVWSSKPRGPAKQCSKDFYQRRG